MDGSNMSDSMNSEYDAVFMKKSFEEKKMTTVI